MPIYEYECSNCHYKFDLMQKINDTPATQCPQCFKNSAVRLVSAAGFQLKGSGWYVTDFKNKGQPPAPTKQTNEVKSSEQVNSDNKKTGEVTKTEPKTKGEKD